MPNRLRLTHPLPDNEHPALVYLKSRRSSNTRRNMTRHLDQIAQMLLEDEKADATQVDWAALRYADTAHVRATLMADTRYRPTTINVILSTLRGVLKESWLLGQMTAEDYQ